MTVHTSTYQHVLPCTCTVQGGTRRYMLVQEGTGLYMEVHGGTRPYKNRLNGTGWYVLACTDPYDSIWVCCPAAGFAAVILPADSAVLETTASNHTNASSSMFQSTAVGPASNSVTSPALIGGGSRQRRFFGGRCRFPPLVFRGARQGAALASSEGTGMGPRVGRARKQSGSGFPGN